MISGRAQSSSGFLHAFDNVPGTVFTGDTDLLGSLRHLGGGAVVTVFGGEDVSS